MTFEYVIANKQKIDMSIVPYLLDSSFCVVVTVLASPIDTVDAVLWPIVSCITVHSKSHDTHSRFVAQSKFVYPSNLLPYSVGYRAYTAYLYNV